MEESNLVIVKYGGAAPLGVMCIEVTYDYGRELGAKLGKEICNSMGSTSRIEIVDSKCRASWEGNSCAKKRI
jgi:hypothetical protein